MSLTLPRLLLAVHAGLLLWSVVGLAEWFAGDVPWPAVSNPAFPRGLLLVHWGVVLAASVVFLVGYARRWRHTPAAMVVAYAAMAAVCIVETFGFLAGSGRFVAMGLEFAAYIGIGMLLFRLPGFVNRFTA